MSSRIPATLQAVFLSSNRGKDVHVPPPESAANFTYLRNWRFQNKAGSSSSNESGSSSNSSHSLFGDSQKKIKRLAAKFKPVVFSAAALMLSSSNHKNNNNNNNTCNVGEKTKLPCHPTDSKRNVGSDKTKLSSPPPTPCPSPVIKKNISPQEFLDNMLRERGYSTDTYNTLLTAYFNQPTTYQQACYGAKMADLIRQGDVKSFRAMMLGGMSSNPCNVYGESLVHMVCRRGSIDLLKVLIAAGVNLQVSDDYGRTPLHDSGWASTPAFSVVNEILRIDNRLFYMMDRRGSLPLSYVHKDHWPAWIKYLDEMKDEHFPILTEPQGPPELTKYGPNTRPLPNPEHALPENLAAMVASGRLSIIEANMMVASEDDDDEDEDSVDSTAEESDDEGDDDDDDENSDDDDHDDSSDYDDESSYCDDDDELFDILQITQARFIG